MVLPLPAIHSDCRGTCRHKKEAFGRLKSAGGEEHSAGLAIARERREDGGCQLDLAGV